MPDTPRGGRLMRGRARSILRTLALLACGSLLLAGAGLPAAATEDDGSAQSAQAWYEQGYALQRQFRTREALAAYKRALEVDPDHGLAHYEVGWSYWLLEDWEQVVAHWERARALEAGPPELADYLRLARERLAEGAAPLVRVPMGERAAGGRPGGGRLALALVARFQQYKADAPARDDHLDRYVFSPKSAAVTPDGAKVYVQALEGKATLVYDARDLRRLAVIPHRFGPGDAGLFDPAETAAVAPRFREAGAPEHFNRYAGKPVEAAFTHGGRYLWVSHYRRDFDRLGVLPSSVAVIDTETDAIVRVMHTGPIPKFLAPAPDGRRLAVVHWGDNTVGLIDATADDPAAFRHDGEIVVGQKLGLDLERKVNRDRYCGHCLRGAVFTPDGRHLLVARMGGGGIAVLDVPTRRHVGTVRGMRPTPRHLVLSPDGETLYVSSNASGYVSAWRTADLITAARDGRERLPPLREHRTGPGTRTIALSPDGRTLYAAVNRRSRLVALDAATLEPIVTIAADSFPVGLAVSPDGRQVWVTSQGRDLRGGNSVMVYRVETP